MNFTTLQRAVQTYNEVYNSTTKCTNLQRTARLYNDLYNSTTSCTTLQRAVQLYNELYNSTTNCKNLQRTVQPYNAQDRSTRSKKMTHLISWCLVLFVWVCFVLVQGRLVWRHLGPEPCFRVTALQFRSTRWTTRSPKPWNPGIS